MDSQNIPPNAEKPLTDRDPTATTVLLSHIYASRRVENYKKLIQLYVNARIFLKVETLLDERLKNFLFRRPNIFSPEGKAGIAISGVRETFLKGIEYERLDEDELYNFLFMEVFLWAKKNNVIVNDLGKEKNTWIFYPNPKPTKYNPLLI
jgi:hypothetical protein